jgi:membrane associated rhomboid family serine protease
MIPLKDDNPTSGKPILTYFVIGSCVLIFLIQITSQSYKTGQLFYSYGLIPSVLMGNNQLPLDLYAIPSWLTIFTSMFMHGGFMHLAGNMLYMWIFADNIEDDLGPKRFLLFYLLAGVGAAMTQVLIDTQSQVPMVGASGAIGGILGAYLINYPKAKVLVLIPFGFFSQLLKIRALYVLGFWFILQFISSGGGVAYAAHIGGFVSGIILILFFNKKVKKKNKVIKGPWD